MNEQMVIGWLLCAGFCGRQCWDTAVTEKGPASALTRLSVQREVGKERQITNVSNAEREEDKVLRLNNRKSRHGPGIWEGFPEEVIFELKSEECQGGC